MNFYDFLDDYHKQKVQCESYRLGQHFINLFIEDSSSPQMQKLWNEPSFLKAKHSICDVIIGYGWSFEKLPRRKDAS